MIKDAKKNKKGLYGKFDKWTRFKSKDSYPVMLFSIFAVFIVLVLIGVGVLIYIVHNNNNPEQNPSVVSDIYDSENIREQRADLYDVVDEELFKLTFVNTPYIYRNNLYISTGADGAGNPSLNNVYVYNLEDEGFDPQIVPVEAAHGNVTDIAVDGVNLYFVDSNLAGGGNICHYDLNTFTTRVIKRFYGASPDIEIAKGKLVWFEQVSANIGSVYVYDVATNKIGAINTTDNSEFAFGGIGVYNNQVAYSVNSYDENGQKEQSNDIGIFDFDTMEQRVINTDHVALSPKISGDILAYTTKTAAGELYAVIDGETRWISDNVLDFNVGDGYIVYEKEDRIYAFFKATNRSIPVTKENTVANLIGLTSNTAFWYDATFESDREIVMFANMREDLWQK